MRSDIDESLGKVFGFGRGQLGTAQLTGRYVARVRYSGTEICKFLNNRGRLFASSSDSLEDMPLDNADLPKLCGIAMSCECAEVLPC